MKIGVSSYSFEQLISSGKETQLSVVKIAKEMGFDGIEFTDLHVPDGMTEKEYAMKIREECDRYSLPVISYTIGANLLKLVEMRNDAEVERVCGKLDVAAVLGAPTLRHDAAWGIDGEAGAYTGFDNVLPLLVEGCRKITNYAKTLGIKTMVENHGTFAQDSSRVARIITGVADPNFGALIDIGNFSCADENNAVAVGNLAPFAKHVHAKDFHIKSGNGPDPGDGFFRSRGGNYLRGAIIGHGDVPVYQCVQILKRSGYDGFISVEFEGMEDCLTGIRTGADNLRRYCL
ncbi:MAG: sugar phosphate isomerase/epimerase [Clostridia bacterium]|nr:sugar phosphate isomerase/epimerase [Clostridia bacterium]